MNLQYISDNNGETITDNNEIPDWHIDLVRKRYEEYLKNPSQAIDFELAITDIEKS